MGAKKATAALARVPREEDLDLWATRITSALQKTVEGIFDTGRQLLAAREKLGHGKWTQLFEDARVPLSIRTAQRFIEIYKRRDVLTPKATYTSHLPASWYALYLLARLPNDTLEWAHANGKITADIEQQQIKVLRATYDANADTTAEDKQETPDFLVTTALVRLEHVVQSEWQKWPQDFRSRFLQALTDLHQELAND